MLWYLPERQGQCKSSCWLYWDFVCPTGITEVRNLEVRRTVLGRVARGRQKFLFWVLHCAATQAVTEPGNGSFVFNSLVPFFIRFFFSPTVSLCFVGKVLRFGRLITCHSWTLAFYLTSILFCTILELLNLCFIYEKFSCLQILGLFSYVIHSNCKRAMLRENMTFWGFSQISFKVVRPSLIND